MVKIQKRKIKRTAFYIRRGLIRWASMLGGTLIALCVMVYIFENPNGRMAFYLLAALLVALGIGNLFYGKEDSK